jgi:hypothetical protein
LKTLLFGNGQSNRDTAYSGPIITCYSNQGFRTRLLIAYHGDRMAGRKLRLYTPETLPPQDPPP